MVEVDGRLKPACCTPAYEGAVINTDTDEVTTCEGSHAGHTGGGGGAHQLTCVCVDNWSTMLCGVVLCCPHAGQDHSDRHTHTALCE